ncbi:hypothetical protein ASG35_26600 [Burkholderia sp. Leaf177]|uniref:hypothetical protein n=1 Tax=Burkholderia sp. Leaf177 TaxID=1736287 RepID=UPI0006F59FC6|nr:hypothetical protein [Burkholderia sp. Leaf177]KQR85374.1 hypothetical protein ASG35_26600 [Burkholderia sp. Leaf177]
MEKNKPSLLIEQLVLVGKRKNYVIRFTQGVNIVYGDSTTGKSSVLECINYLLGSSKFVYDREIELSVRFIMMEVRLNSLPYVIKRDIFKPNEPIEVYTGELNSIELTFPKKLTPNFGLPESGDGFFSDFMMTALNIPNIKMRQSPSKVDSAMVRLSFRDVFKYCYLKQDDVGSKALLGGNNYVVATKNKQTFKYLFNLLDTNVSDAQGDLSSLVKRRDSQKEKYDVVSDFLRETEFKSESELADAHDVVALQEESLRQQLNTINAAMIAGSESYSFLKETLLEISARISLMEKDGAASERAVDRYVRLRNDYQTDIEKLKSIRTSKSVIGEQSDSFSCPLCDSTVNLENIKAEFSIDGGDRAAQEANVLVKRVRDLKDLIQREQDKQVMLTSELKLLNEDRDRARRLLDDETKEMITPYLSERDGLSAELAKLGESRKQLHQAIKVRNQQKGILAEIVTLDERIAGMQEKLETLRAAAPSLEGVLSKIGDFLSAYLHRVRIKDQRDVSISKRSLLPVLRSRDYSDITSGGLRTILSIGFYLSLLETAIDSSCNLPTFLMVDTVGKYLGKTQKQYVETNTTEDRREEVSDPNKYLNMYSYMFSSADRAEKKGVSAQIIVVDNDVPPTIQTQFGDSIVAHFSSEGIDDLPKGLIDDAHVLTY